ncbi:MAG: hypothetical protein IJ563_05590 [Selenomonadaceae bacterium]|nr:hypothetical protein [Selenomonadaceae bacterium]
MEKLKKYIFPFAMLIFVILLSMGITHITQPEKPPDAPIIAGWKHVASDRIGNEYYIDADSIVRDEAAEGELRFSAKYRKVYSDRGREALAQAYAGSGIDTAQMNDVDYEIDVMHFRDIDGEKFVTSTESTFYKSDDTEIPALRMSGTFDEGDYMHALPGKSVGELLYDYAYTRVNKD